MNAPAKLMLQQDPLVQENLQVMDQRQNLYHSEFYAFSQVP